MILTLWTTTSRCMRARPLKNMWVVLPQILRLEWRDSGKNRIFAKVSDDQFGTFVERYFENEGIDISHISRCQNGEKLGLTFTEILSPTESSILMYRGSIADLQLSVEDIDEEYIKSAKALLISGTALAASPSREAALKAVSLAKKNQVPVIFDIDYRAYTWKNHDEIAIYYSAVASQADIILGSREEYDLTENLIAPGRTDVETAKAWCAKGARIVVIKHGREGSTAYAYDGNSFSIKPFPVKALKGFGGGDGYAAAFYTGCWRGRSFLTAWRWAAPKLPCWWPATPAALICQAPKRFTHLSDSARMSTARW